MYQPDKPMPNDGDLVDLLAQYVPDASLRGRILVHNAARLYRYPEGAAGAC
jgi:predicted TIM-barrel fold metal-dependent hydrolase